MKCDNKGNIGDFVEAERTTSDKNPNSILFHENNLNPNYTRHHMNVVPRSTGNSAEQSVSFPQFSTGRGMGPMPSFKPPKSK